MLVLTRKLQQQIKIGDQITVTILRVKGSTVRIGIDAPREVRVVRGELEAYGAGLEDKPELLALSRSDLVEPKELAKLAKKLAKSAGKEPFVVSAATTDGVEPLLDAIVQRLGTEHVEDDGEAELIEWSPL